MKKAYCTIITYDYLCYALALNSSLLAFDHSVQFKILIADKEVDAELLQSKYPNVQVFNIHQLCTQGVARVISDRYAKANVDCFRWSMKPVFIKHLLKLGFDQVFFLDPDIFFFSPFDFLSDDLRGNSVLLTPHWRSSAPEKDEVNFAILQTSGLFNAGFVGVSSSGIDAMDWWAHVCAYKCEKNPEQGLFVDQAYLDLLPIYFDKIAIERNRGCNVANWNQVECKRVAAHDGKVKINGKYDVVFIHFTSSTINGIRSGEDFLLRPYLNQYLNILERYRSEVNLLFASNGTESVLIPSSYSNHQQKLPVDPTFFSPKLSAAQIDVYQVRNAIITSLKGSLDIFKGTLLDVGCGQMPYKSLLTQSPSKVTRYIGLDLNENPIYENQPDITWHNGKIPLEDDSADCAICTEVLEHCPDPEAVLKEIHRVLKPAGCLLVTVPFIWPLHDVPYDEYRYTPFSLHRHLTASGFTDVCLNAMGGWDASLAQMMGLWVRRRPMKSWARIILSHASRPIIRWLIAKDESKKIIFNESTMFTGISGTARKPERNT